MYGNTNYTVKDKKTLFEHKQISRDAVLSACLFNSIHHVLLQSDSEVPQEGT